jgi:hypothetical protein
MSGNVFVGDHIRMDVCLDSARRQLERLARDGVLLSASEHAYGAGITGLWRRRDSRPGCPGWSGYSPEICWKPRAVPGCGCDGKRSGPTAPCSRLWMQT